MRLDKLEDRARQISLIAVKPFLFILLLGLASFGGEPELRVPDGFIVERVSAPGAVSFPMFGALADDGRLFVTESSGGDLYAELQKQTRGCRVSVLRDADHDGKYERADVFFENLVPSMGLAWRDGKLYVADPPDLIALEDTDGDGRADKRTAILSGFGHNDNGSLHGLIFGPDGLLYVTLGRQGDAYRLNRPAKSILEGQNGALLRCKPDGSNVEVLSRGFENLVEIAFMPGGEIVGTVNWFHLPQDGVRDALVHLVPGGVYPLNAQARAETNFFYSGELLPPIEVYPAVAFSGLMRHSGKNFPLEMRDNLFSAQHNTRKIVRHQISRKGASFATQDADFLTTDDPDFHPSDVLEDADGSIIVIDTGSWYTHHCPTGRIRKTAAPGGIYRITYKGTNFGSGVPPAENIAVANDDPFVRHKYMYDLHKTADKPTLLRMLDDPDPVKRRAALVVLDQSPHNALPFDAAFAGLKDDNGWVRQAALDSFRKHPDWMPRAIDYAKQLLSKDSITQDTMDLAAILISDAEIRRKVAETIQNSERRINTRLVFIEFAANAIGKVAKGEQAMWRDAVRALLNSKEQSVIAAALRGAAALQIGDLDDQLTALVTNESLNNSLRLEALRQLSVEKRFADAARFHLFLTSIAPKNNAATRLAAAELVNANLTTDQINAVLAKVENDSLVGPSIAAALARRSHLDSTVRAKLDEIENRFKTTTDDQQKILADLEPLLTGGDENRGQQLFIGKAGCSACHRVGKHGGLVGPDLTRVGRIRSGRDLVESIALPSATFAQGYEPYRLTLTSDAVLTGVRVRSLDDSFVLRDASGAETRLRQGEIKSTERATVSIMPDGLLNGLSREEIRDLLAYLQNLK